MAAKPKIKWRAIDEERLTRAIDRFNRKLGRVAKNHPEWASLQPPRIKKASAVREMQESTRDWFNRYLKDLELYAQRGMEQPYITESEVATTQWQKKVIDRNFKSINARRSALLQAIQPSITKGNIHIIQENNLQPRKNTVEEIQVEKWNLFVKNLELQTMRELEGKESNYRENYMLAVQRTFPNDYEYIKYLAEQLDDKEFIVATLGGLYMQITWIYDEKEYEKRRNLFIQEWEYYNRNSGKTDLGKTSARKPKGSPKVKDRHYITREKM